MSRSKFEQFKHLRKRMRRTLNYGKRRMDSLTEPLSRMVVDYFERNSCSFDYLDMGFASSLTHEACVDPCTLLIAMIYIDRLKHNTIGTNRNNCIERDHSESKGPTSSSAETFLAALVLATKFLNDGGLDEFVWNDEWAISSGFTKRKVNELELKLLDDLNWNILVPEQTFDEAFDSMERWIAVNTMDRTSSMTYNELNVLAAHLPDISDLKHFLRLILTMTAAYLSTIATVALVFSVAMHSQTQSLVALNTSTLNGSQNTTELSPTISYSDVPTTGFDSINGQQEPYIPHLTFTNTSLKMDLYKSFELESMLFQKSSFSILTC